ncbi:hypothetical protein [Anoxybacteroides amylolyticum]|uniref:Flagellar hook-length control FliK family protein n=1 Tax=Anoxybacteroides amylolyticum TaxID=294699 RepID=A0A160F6N5_9BACL|nr:hypothetical protein [Anoxybacillus amylolyticus]ANB61615.1 flagellar hook-length control FliK family protein [Anoxybacillus amylolyticus]
MIQRIDGFSEQRWPALASSLQNGQVVYGKVEKIGANGMAFVRIGGEMMEAEVQTPLQVGQFYSFQVTKKEDAIVLKRLDVPSERSEATIEQTATQLASKWRLSREMEPLLRFLLQKQLPFTKAEVAQAEKWLLATPEKDVNFRALQMMFANRLPVAEAVFFALKAVQSPEPLATQLLHLQQAIQAIHGQRSEAQQSLLHELERMTHFLVDDKDENEMPQLVAKHMKSLVKALGLEYEANIAKNVQTSKALQGVKPLLLRAKQETSDEATVKLIDTLIARFTGQQLLSYENGPIQPFFIQLPFLFGKQTDVVIHYQTRKKQNGELDPHYCRLLFYLQLPALKEIAVDVRIQHSIVHVSIWNDTPQLEQFVSLAQPLLKERLSSLGYTLSTVKVDRTPAEKGQDELFSRILNNYSGVDYRI